MESLDKTLGLLTNPTNLVFFIAVIVPGFIAVRAYETIRGGEQRKMNDAIIDVIVYGFASAAIWLPILRAVDTITDVGHKRVGEIIATPLGLIGTPILIAWAWYQAQKWLAQGGQIADLDPKPWDRIFTSIKDESHDVGIVLTLPDDRKIGGRYARETPGDGFASSYPAPEQLMIGEVWSISAEGRFISKVGGSKGLIIDKKDILTVEFYDWTTVVGSLNAPGPVTIQKAVPEASTPESALTSQALDGGNRDGEANPGPQ